MAEKKIIQNTMMLRAQKEIRDLKYLTANLNEKMIIGMQTGMTIVARDTFNLPSRLSQTTTRRKSAGLDVFGRKF